MTNKRSIKDDFNLITILIIPIAIAVNFICGNLVLTLKLPLYLDSIGTFLVAILAGPWVGGLTGLLSIAINSIMDPSLLPFALIAGVLGVVIGILARKKMFVSFGRFLISAILVSVVAVIMSVIVTIVFFGGFDTSGNSIMIAGMISAGIPFWPAQFIGNFISEVPDKFISLLVPYLVIRGMSERYLYKFSNGQVFIDARQEKK
ncbi:MAG: hypothetical protein Q4P20_13275 [Eubacteriales bacterium]|nr:hypothetical protein [Eubacteriales bacterium]